MKKVTIIDYGMGNLLSISRAIEHLGGEVFLSKSHEDIINADYLILPGVGAFPAGMNELNQRGYIEPINEYVRKGNPFLGICLGMQMLFSSSEEIEKTNGLGLIKGEVVKLPKNNQDNSLNKVPHVAWTQIFNTNSSLWDKSVLDGLRQNAYVYFVHSYYPSKVADQNILAYTTFGDLNFGSVVYNENVIGMQYHPEKSGELGSKMLENFMNL